MIHDPRMRNGIFQGNGRAWGYTFWRMENGDLMYSEWQNTSQAVVNPDRSRKAPGLVLAGHLLRHRDGALRH